jgi:hypothetical protein
MNRNHTSERVNSKHAGGAFSDAMHANGGASGTPQEVEQLRESFFDALSDILRDEKRTSLSR